MKRILLTLGLLALALAGTQLDAAPLGATFTYQGRLADGANPANGTIPMEFRLWDSALGGINVGTPAFVSTGVPVANGLFTIDLDFGASAFSGEARWLEIRINGTLMTTRQRVAPTPNAIYASTAGTVKNGAIQASQLGTPGAPAAGQMLSFDGNSLVWQTSPWRISGANAYYNAGNIGIGTAGPSGRLTVATSDDTTPSFVTSFDGRHSIFGTASEGVGISYSAGNGAGYITALAPGVAWKDLVLQASTLSFNPSGGATALSIANNGNVNVNGPITAASHVNISGNLEVGNGAFSTGGLNEFNVQGILDLALGETRTRFVVKQNGNVGIGTPAPQAKLHVNGEARFSILTITGGSDVAEPFQMSTQDIPKGAVVVIDEENAGKLKLSNYAYDNRVAGIVSGANSINPGIALHQEGALEGGQNVALSGRVYVQADASSGPIKPGDLLTTSNTPGHAMKVTDHAQAQGAIIGKAMSALKEGKGMVLVLVTLQ